MPESILLEIPFMDRENHPRILRLSHDELEGYISIYYKTREEIACLEKQLRLPLEGLLAMIEAL